MSNSNFQPCAKRHRLVTVDREGNRTPVQRCAEPSAEPFFEIVSPDVCASCPVRRQVTLAAIGRSEYQPPLADNLKSKRADTGQDPVWPACVDRQVAEVPACCGSMVKIKVCNSVDCFRMGSQVTIKNCNTCVYRREK